MNWELEWIKLIKLRMKCNIINVFMCICRIEERQDQRQKMENFNKAFQKGLDKKAVTV